MRALPLLILAASSFAWIPAQAVETRLGAHAFTLPEGFEIEQVAASPFVDRPIAMAFDEQGRLYVSDSSGSNDKVEKQLAEKPHRIVRLEDRDGDGRFETSVVFADRMMLPQGVMWLDGSLYVAAPPSIWKLTDTDGDGLADRREEWFKGKTLTGCANDLHGPYLGRDGWIYWCKGAFAEQTHNLPGRPSWKTRASHIFRARRDGTGLEPVMTGGMDNPVDVIFTPEGERIFSCTFFQHPSGGQRDGLIHAIYGGVYGKPHDVLDGHPRTGELMPVLTHLGPGAPSGLHYYESSAFGEEWRGNLFTCLFNLRKVTRHILVPSGATFTTQDSDFLVSDSTDFHPTDVIEDADGSLLICDTGGWYKLCCPTSQLHKPDVLGAVYRVRRKGAPTLDDPRGLTLGWDEVTPSSLAARLDDRRPAVRARTIEELAKHGDDAIEFLLPVRRLDDPEKLLNKLWTLARIDSPAARAAVRRGLLEPMHGDARVTHAAAHVVALWRDAEAAPVLMQRWSELANWPAAHRAATEALGRIGSPPTSPVLLQAADEKHDRALDHAITYALFELADREALREGLKSGNRAARKAAFIVLAQLDGQGLSRDEVQPRLFGNDAVLRALAADLVRSRPEWAEAIASEMLNDGGSEPLTATRELLAPLQSEEGKIAAGALLSAGVRQPLFQPELAEASTRSALRHAQKAAVGGDAAPEVRAEVLSSLASIPQVRSGMAAALVPAVPTSLRTNGLLPRSRALALEAMTRARFKELPPEWVDPLVNIVNAQYLPEESGIGESRPSPERDSALKALTSKPFPKALLNSAAGSLLALAGRSDTSREVRLRALESVPPSRRMLDDELFQFLVRQLAAEAPLTVRAAAADLLAKSVLTAPQRVELVGLLRTAVASEVPRLLGAFENANDEITGRAVLGALRGNPARASLALGLIKPRLAKFPPAVQAELDTLLAQSGSDPAKQRARLEELTATLGKGDVRRGQAVFNSTKAACVTCHAIGYVGGTLGPDLTRIGAIRTERDLLEAIVFPSASFVRSYEPVSLRTTSGEELTGLLRSDSAEEVVLATGPQTELRIRRAEIAEQTPGAISPMPPGYDQVLSAQELADLVSFLQNAK